MPARRPSRPSPRFTLALFCSTLMCCLLLAAWPAAASDLEYDSSPLWPLCGRIIGAEDQ